MSAQDFIGETIAQNQFIKYMRGSRATINFVHSYGVVGNIAEAQFTVRDRPDGNIVFMLTKTAQSDQWTFPTSDNGTVTIYPDDTDGLITGTLVYDIRLIHTDNDTAYTCQFGRFEMTPNISNDAGGGGMASLYDSQLIAWAIAGSFRITNPTYYEAYPNLVESGTGIWPDLSAGTYTTTSVNELHHAAEAWTITHSVRGKTVTQSTMTYDTRGNPTNAPIPTIS